METVRYLVAVFLLGAVCHCQNRGSKRYTPSPFLQREDLHFRPEQQIVDEVGKINKIKVEHRPNHRPTSAVSGKKFQNKHKPPSPRITSVSKSVSTTINPVLRPNNFVFKVRSPVFSSNSNDPLQEQNNVANGVNQQSVQQNQTPPLIPLTLNQPTARRRVTVQRRRKPNSKVTAKPVSDNLITRRRETRIKSTSGKQQNDITFSDKSGDIPIIPQVAIRPHSQIGRKRPPGLTFSPEKLNPLSVSPAEFNHQPNNGDGPEPDEFSSGSSNQNIVDAQIEKISRVGKKQRVISIPNTSSDQKTLAARRVRFRNNARSKPSSQQQQLQETTTTDQPSIKLPTVNSFLQVNPGFVTTGRPDINHPQPDINRQWVSSIPSIGSIPLAPVSQEVTENFRSSLPQQHGSKKNINKFPGSTDFDNAQREVFEPGTFSFSASTFGQDSSRFNFQDAKQDTFSQRPPTNIVPNFDFREQPITFNKQSQNIQTGALPSHNFETVHINDNSVDNRNNRRKEVSRFKSSHADNFISGGGNSNENRRNSLKLPNQDVVDLQRKTSVNSKSRKFRNSRAKQFSQNHLVDTSKTSSANIGGAENHQVSEKEFSTPLFTTRLPGATNSVPFSTGSFHIVDGQLKTAPFLDLAKDSTVISHQFPRFSEVTSASVSKQSSDPNENSKNFSSFSPNSAVNTFAQQSGSFLQEFTSTPDVSVQTNPSEISSDSVQRKIFRPGTNNVNHRQRKLRTKTAVDSTRDKNSFSANSAIDNNSNTPSRQGRVLKHPVRPVAQPANSRRSEIRQPSRTTTTSISNVETSDNKDFTVVANKFDKSSLPPPASISFPSFHQALANKKDLEDQHPTFNILGGSRDSSGFHEEVILSHPSSNSEVLPGFTCEGKSYGYYADTINACRVFHICQPVEVSNNSSYYSRYSFTCGRETIFDQSKLSCIHEREAMPCKDSSQWLHKNGEFGEIAL